MLTQLLDTLQKIGLEPTAEDVADLLWLAEQLPAPPKQRKRTASPRLSTGVVPLNKSESEGAPRSSLPVNRREQFFTLHNTETSEQSQPQPTANLYPIQAANSAQGAGGIKASLFRSAAAYALPEPLELARSLRPLKRRMPSRTKKMLDEIATAEHIADTVTNFGAKSGYWTPIVKPAPERWLRLALVVDESSSMSIWEHTVAEFLILLERQGAFRDIQTWGMRSDPTAEPQSAGVQFYAGIGSHGQRDRLRHPGELLDESGRRLILVMSDCIAPIWHNGAAASLLMGWGQHGPLALVQMLPERMWQRTGLRNYPDLHLRAHKLALPIKNWIAFGRATGLTNRSTALPLPVVTLEADWMGKWARALAGNSGLWLPGVLLHTESAPVPTTQQRSAEELLRNFYATASPLAQQLAIYLSCAPLTLPIMRLVQRVTLPKARQVHLAEVLTSGLIVRPTQGSTYEAADQQNFAFVQGVRDLLQRNLRSYEMEWVASAISSFVGERSGKQILDFRALLADPDAEGNLTIDALNADYQDFAKVTATVLRRFGDRYDRAAARLERTVYGSEAVQSNGTPSLNINSETSQKSQRHPQIDQQTTIYGLLIGINQYADAAVPQLYSCLADVQHTAAWLQERHRVPPSTIQVLTDQQATKRAILAALQSLGQQVREGDQVYIHYSGRDQAIATDDPYEGDGLEETLFVYDSKPDERASLITHRELVDLLKKIDRRGAQVGLVLDTCRAGSGLLCRHDLGEILVIAASHEGELSYEGEIEGELNYASKIEGTRTGIASYFLAQAMINYHPGMTWAEVFDHVYVNVKNRYPDQTPQLIGPRDLVVFSNERKPVEPYLLVTKKDGFQITVSAHEALTLAIGAKLALFPAGSDLQDLPLRRATVTAIESNSLTAEVEQLYGEDLPSAPIESGYRAKLLSFDENPYLAVAWESSLPAPTTEPIVRFAQNDVEVVYRVRSDSSTATLLIEDQNDHVLWQITPDPAQNINEQANLVRTVLRSIALYHRVFVQRNQEETALLADAIELTVITPAVSEPNTVVAEQPTTLKLHNRTDVDLYISVWMLDNYLGVQRIYPPASDCLLLGKGRQLQLSLTLHLSDAEQTSESITFKVFATHTPANLDVLQLPRLAQPVDLGDLEQFAEALRKEPAATKAPRKRAARKESPRIKQTKVEPSNENWNPGGPVAIRSKLWRNGQTLRVRFLDGDRRLQERVHAVMLLWTEHANLHFAFGNDPDAEIRISFRQEGSWSYTGTDCLIVAKAEPTTNFGWLQPNTTEDEIRRVVLREVGHALGLGLGLLSPVANLPWNREAVFREYMAPPNNWTRELVEQNFFNKYNKAEVTAAPPDAKSIMVNPIPKHLTDGKLEVGWNRELSEGDKAFIAQIYPQLVAA